MAAAFTRFEIFVWEMDPKEARYQYSLGPVNTYFAPTAATDFIQHEA
jgi:hypothetical protein